MMHRVRRSAWLASAALWLAACEPSTPTGIEAEAPAVEKPAPEEPAAATPDLAPAESAAAPAGAIEPVDFVHEISDLDVDPVVSYGRLDNGLRYAIVKNDTPPRQAALRVRFDVGSVFEADDQRGLAHFLEHMAFNGSTNVPEGEMVKTLERLGLAFGPDTNAYTSFDETVYQLDLPETSDEVLDVAFMLARETAERLTIAPEAVDRERGVVLSELRTRNTPGLRSLIHRFEFLFPDARFADRFPIGTAEILTSAPAQRIRDLYEGYYRPERTFVVFAGDVDPALIEGRIKQTFGDWTATAPAGPTAELGAATPRALDAAVFSDPAIPTSISINLIRPAENAPDTIASRRERVLTSIGANIVSRRLATLSRQADAVILNGSASVEEYFDVADVASVDVVAEPDDWRAALDLAETERRRALEFGFSAAEVAEQVANWRTSLKDAADQAATRDSRSLADGVTGAFSEEQVFSPPASALARFEALAPEITPEAVQAALAEAWVGGEPQVHMSSALEVDAETLKAAYVAAAALPVTPYEVINDAAWAYEAFGEPGAVAERSMIEDLGMTTVRFNNGVRLTVKPTDFEDEAVYVSVAFGEGSLLPAMAKPGLAYLVSNALTEGGLQAHSADALDRILAGRTVGVSASAGAEAFRFDAVTTPDDFKLQLQLLGAFMTAPGWREEGLAQFRKLVSIWYETLDATPQGVAAKEVSRLLASGDARFGIPPRDDILAASFEDLRAAIDASLAQGALDVTIVGDIDVEATVAEVGAVFGALGARADDRAPFPESRVVRFPAAPAEPITLRHAGEPDRAMALVYWPAIDDSDVKAARVATLMRDVLQLKLTEVVREREGATYSPNATSSLSSTYPEYGFVGVSLDLEPDAVGRFFEVVDGLVADMAAGAVSADELERARKPLLESLEENLENNGYWLGLAGDAQRKPDRLERHRTAAAGFAAITVEEVVAAAQAYLKAETAYRVRILPPEAAGATEE